MTLNIRRGEILLHNWGERNWGSGAGLSPKRAIEKEGKGRRIEKKKKKAIWEIVEEYLPTQQILRNIFKNPLVLYNSGVLWWDIEDRLEFQDKLEPGCIMEGAQQNVLWSLRWP